jgi:SAM-dependent methyltransferase
MRQQETIETLRLKEGLTELSNAGILRATQAIYPIPSLAAWRAAELRVLRDFGPEFVGPILEIGCGSGLFASLLLSQIEVGIDYNPRAVEICRRSATIYREVRQMDARDMAFSDASFATVFANCVIEHIPQLDRLLAECYRVLAPGGKLITTVPLHTLNQHLLLPFPWYARQRARDLEHLNLLSKENWLGAFARAGFHHVRAVPYLSGKACRAWDEVDGPACFGAGPVRLARVYQMTMAALPSKWRRAVEARWHRHFSFVLEDDPSCNSCAMALVAERG